MPFRKMTEKEIKETQELIEKYAKDIERLEGIKAYMEAQIKEGVYVSGDLSGRKDK